MKESVLNFACAGEALVGILAEPEDRANDVGVLIVVGGPQYRAGSHRQFTLLARHLAGNGFAALRFDYRGMGDSTGEMRDFLAVDEDIAAAIDALLAARPALRRVVLCGLCDAASASLLYLDNRQDPRVAGLVLLNPWVRSAATLAQTHVKHYYVRRLREREFWLKLLRGGVGLKALRTLAGNLRLARSTSADQTDTRSFQQRMATAAEVFTGQLLLMISEDDYTAREFLGHVHTSSSWQAVLARPTSRRVDLPGADHTLSTPRHLDLAHSAIVQWLKQLPVTR